MNEEEVEERSESVGLGRNKWVEKRMRVVGERAYELLEGL